MEGEKPQEPKKSRKPTDEAVKVQYGAFKEHVHQRLASGDLEINRERRREDRTGSVPKNPQRSRDRG